MMIPTSKNVIEIPHLLKDKIQKRIIFAAEGISIEKPGSGIASVFIKAEKIASFTYGVNWISGYCFNFGRQYFINIYDHNGELFPIKLITYYRIKNKKYYEAWVALLNQMWEHYFINTFHYYRDLYSIKQDFELLGVKFNSKGINWQDNHIAWHEIAINNYRTYFSIHHKDDTKNVKHCNFKNDRNAFILQCLLKQIIDEYQVKSISKEV